MPKAVHFGNSAAQSAIAAAYNSPPILRTSAAHVPFGCMGWNQSILNGGGGRVPLF